MNTAKEAIAIAATQVGYREGRTASGLWNNNQRFSLEVSGLEWSNYMAWCATFMTWVYQNSGTKGYKASASVAAFRDYYKDEKRFTEYPTLGAVALFGTKGNVHTGIVTGWNADNVFCIEGNTNSSGSAEGNGVYRKVRPRRSTWVMGYGIPMFGELISSADPKWDGHSFDLKVSATPKTTWTKDGITYDSDGYEQGHGSFVTALDLSLLVGSALGTDLSPEAGLQRDQVVASINAIGTSQDQTLLGAYAAWQRAQDYQGADADGVPGMKTLTALGERIALAVRL